MREGGLFGETAFFTEVPQLEGVRAAAVCRVLTIPRAAYAATAEGFPLGARAVLDNLRVRSQEVGKHRRPPCPGTVVGLRPRCGPVWKRRLQS